MKTLREALFTKDHLDNSNKKYGKLPDLLDDIMKNGLNEYIIATVEVKPEPEIKKAILVPSYPEGFKKVTNLFKRSDLEIDHDLKHLYTLECKYLTEAQKCFIFFILERNGRTVLAYGQYVYLSGWSNIGSYNDSFNNIEIIDIEYLDDIKSIRDLNI